MRKEVPAPGPEQSWERVIDAQAALGAAFLRYNKLQYDSGKQGIPEPGAGRFGLVVEYNARLTVVVSGRIPDSDRVAHLGQFTVGHYDPARDGFIPFPELLTKEEFSAVDPWANGLKDKLGKGWGGFNFDNEAIKSLRKKHREVLEKDNFVYRLAMRHNDPLTAEEPPVLQIFPDEASSFFVGLKPKEDKVQRHVLEENYEAPMTEIYSEEGAYLGKMILASNTYRDECMNESKKNSDSVVTVFLLNALGWKNGVPERQNVLQIPIAEINLLDPTEPPFLARGGLIKNDELTTLVGLARELSQLKKDGGYPNLDLQRVIFK